MTRVLHKLAQAAEPAPRQSLALIARRGVALQPDAERILADCVLPGDKGAELAHRARRVVNTYFRLRESLRLLPPSLDSQLLEHLLNYHQQVLEQSMLFAFGVKGPRSRTELAAQFSGGLGEPAQELRDLAARLNPRDAVADA